MSPNKRLMFHIFNTAYDSNDTTTIRPHVSSSAAEQLMGKQAG